MITTNLTKQLPPTLQPVLRTHFLPLLALSEESEAEGRSPLSSGNVMVLPSSSFTNTRLMRCLSVSMLSGISTAAVLTLVLLLGFLASAVLSRYL